MLDFSFPNIMGVINITPDSATSVGRYLEPIKALKYAKQLVQEGADILDFGAEATNPKLNPCISLQEEMDRLLPVLELVTKELDTPISVDTSKPQIMHEAIKQGVKIINDTRALRRDGAIEAVAAAKNVMLCLMHMSFPEGKAENINYENFKPDVVTVVKDFLKEQINVCEDAGIDKTRLIIDPGLGYGNFGKNTQDNLSIIKNLERFQELKLPILIGASRKTFIGDILKNTIEKRLAGSIGAAVIAAYNGASIIRTHDVKPTKDAIQIAMEIKNAS